MSNAIELSQQELEEVSGGIDIFLSGAVFEKRDVFIGQQSVASSMGAETTSVVQSSYTFSSAFQFIGLGFNSVSDVMKVLRGLSRIFRNS